MRMTATVLAVTMCATLHGAMAAGGGSCGQRKDVGGGEQISVGVPAWALKHSGMSKTDPLWSGGHVRCNNKTHTLTWCFPGAGPDGGGVGCWRRSPLQSGTKYWEE